MRVIHEQSLCHRTTYRLKGKTYSERRRCDERSNATGRDRTLVNQADISVSDTTLLGLDERERERDDDDDDMDMMMMTAAATTTMMMMMMITGFAEGGKPDNPERNPPMSSPVARKNRYHKLDLGSNPRFIAMTLVTAVQ
nr:hypothetical protein BaRGS_023743 [Batillaria attramentaria]